MFTALICGSGGYVSWVFLLGWFLRFFQIPFGVAIICVWSEIIKIRRMRMMSFSQSGGCLQVSRPILCGETAI